MMDLYSRAQSKRKKNQESFMMKSFMKLGRIILAGVILLCLHYWWRIHRRIMMNENMSKPFKRISLRSVSDNSSRELEVIRQQNVKSRQNAAALSDLSHSSSFSNISMLFNSTSIEGRGNSSKDIYRKEAETKKFHRPKTKYEGYGCNSYTDSAHEGPECLRFFTYASHAGTDDKFCKSLLSAVRMGIDLQVLGWGMEWKGLQQKFEAVLEILKTLPAECTVVFNDGHDVLYVQSPQHILDMYHNLVRENNASIIFSAECGCWPQMQRDNGKSCNRALKVFVEP
jgi:hypothetical protein